MAGSSGPNIVNNNLVLHLDAANTKSFRGEPTTNLVPSPYNYSLYAYVTGPTDSTVLNEYYQTTSVKTYTISNVVNTARAAIFPENLTTATYYTFSLKWKYNGTNTSSPSISLSAAKGNPEGGANNNTFTSEVSETKSIGNGWYFTYYTFVFSSVPTSKCVLTFGINTGTDNTYLNQTFDIYEVQFEQKSYATPYVLGTRGTTVATGGGWKDRTQYENNGELVNGPTYTSNNGGNIILDGTNDYIITPSFYDLSITNQITATIWCKSNTSTWNDYGFLISKRDQFILHPIINSKEVVAYVNTTTGGWQSIFFTPSPEITTFNSYTLHYTSGVLKIYFNGVLITTNNSVGATLSSSASQLYIGKDSGIERYFNGQISSVMIYNRALSDNEILQNYYAHKSRFNLQ